MKIVTDLFLNEKKNLSESHKKELLVRVALSGITSGNISVFSCYGKKSNHYGPCGEEVDMPVALYDAIVFPCKKHLHLYLENNWVEI